MAINPEPTWQIITVLANTTARQFYVLNISLTPRKQKCLTIGKIITMIIVMVYSLLHYHMTMRAPYLTLGPCCPLWGLYHNTRKWVKACAKSNPIIFPLHLYKGMNFLPKFFTSNGMWMDFTTYIIWLIQQIGIATHKKKLPLHKMGWPILFSLTWVGLTAELYLSSRGSMGPIIMISYS